MEQQARQPGAIDASEAQHLVAGLAALHQRVHSAQHPATQPYSHHGRTLSPHEPAQWHHLIAAVERLRPPRLFSALRLLLLLPWWALVRLMQLPRSLGAGARWLSAVAVLLLTLLLAAFGWLWASTPSADQTLRMARAAHLYVIKETRKDGSVLLKQGEIPFAYHFRLENISDTLINAVVSSEDHRFGRHDGSLLSRIHYGVIYKVGNFTRVSLNCIASKVGLGDECRGGSTLSQQLARQLLVSGHRNLSRKLLELVWSIKMDLFIDPDTLLELYLNRVPLGNQTFGVGMGAQYYFGKPVSDLNLHESVLLASAIKSPRNNPFDDLPAARERAELLLLLLAKQGHIDPDELRLPPNGPALNPDPDLRRPFFGHLLRYLKPRLLALLADQPDGTYKVITTLDAEMQLYAQDAVDRLVASDGRAEQGALLSIDAGSGAILAMVGGAGEQGRYKNRCVDDDGFEARQVASTFKPLLVLAALERGLATSSPIDASPISISLPNGGHYRPSNSHHQRYPGSVSLKRLLVDSINTASVRLLHERVGLEGLREMAERLGIDNRAALERPQWSLAVGAVELPLLDMVGAYSAFANGAEAHRPWLVQALFDNEGHNLWPGDDRTSHDDLDRGAISDLNQMLSKVLQEGTGRAALVGIDGPERFAGKTGTSDGNTDAWFIGYNRRQVTGVWVGNDDHSPMPGLSGGSLPAQIWNRYTGRLLKYTRTLDGLEPLP